MQRSPGRRYQIVAIVDRFNAPHKANGQFECLHIGVHFLKPESTFEFAVVNLKRMIAAE